MSSYIDNVYIFFNGSYLAIPITNVIIFLKSILKDIKDTKIYYCYFPNYYLSPGPLWYVYINTLPFSDGGISIPADRVPIEHRKLLNLAITLES